MLNPVDHSGGTSLAMLYNGNGFVTEENDPVTGVIYRQASDFDSRGQLEAASLADDGTGFLYGISRTYHPETGQVAGINANNGANVILDLDYSYIMNNPLSGTDPSGSHEVCGRWSWDLAIFMGQMQTGSTNLAFLEWLLGSTTHRMAQLQTLAMGKHQSQT